MTEEWSRGRGERRRFRRLDDLGEVTEARRRQLTAAITGHAAGLDGFPAGYFRVLDVARCLQAGIGSRGVDRYYVLIEGPEGKDAVILDVKAQVERPSLARLAPDARLPAGGCRVALAEKAMLSEADDHLGCFDLTGQSFSVRQRNPYTKSMKARKIEGSSGLVELARELGRVLATAHARADRDFGSEQVAHGFDDAVVMLLATAAGREDSVRQVTGFAAGYARQIEVDQKLFAR